MIIETWPILILPCIVWRANEGLLLTMNDLGEARDLYEESIAIRRKVFGERHPAVAESLNNIGLLLYSQNRFGDAQPLMEQSIDIKRICFGPRHTMLAASLHNYAVLLHRMGRLVEVRCVDDSAPS